MAKAPGFSVATIPARSGDQELSFRERASPRTAPGAAAPQAGAGNRLEPVSGLQGGWGG